MSIDRGLLLIGGGGHCKSVLDTLITSDEFSQIGIIDKMYDSSKFTSIMNVPLIGNDDQIEEFFYKGFRYAFITVGSVGNPVVREKLFNKVKKIGFQIPNIIDKTSVVSKEAWLGEGIYIGKKAVVNAEVTLGDCVIINSGSIVEHECRIEEFVHVAPGSVICGNVQIGKNSHIGAGSILKQGVCIGENTILGMGSVVLKDITSNTTAYGNPCREVGHD